MVFVLSNARGKSPQKPAVLAWCDSLTQHGASRNRRSLGLGLGWRGGDGNGKNSVSWLQGRLEEPYLGTMSKRCSSILVSTVSMRHCLCLMILWVHTCKGRGSTLSILPQEPPNLLFETSVSDWPGAPWTGKELYWLTYCPSPLSFFPQMVSLCSLGWLWSHYPPASVSKSQPPFEIASKKTYN